MHCPCGSGKEFQDCCEPFLEGKALPPTPEALMRSRYSAYVKVRPAYLRETLAPESRGDFKESDVLEWAKQSEWLGLTINKAEGNSVEFTAKYRTQGKVLEHHEISVFRKEGPRWYFVDGESHVHEEGQSHHNHVAKSPVVRATPKLGRNDPCSCGSGKKFKKCCGSAA